nr:pilus assembly protein PilM [Limnohabitans radicicola]
MLKNRQRAVSGLSTRGYAVRSGLKLWPGFPFRRITSAWGIALGDHGVTLVSLGQTADREVRVQRALHLSPPAWVQASDNYHDWLVESLREASEQEVRRHRRLVLALPMSRCQSGQFACPAALDADALQAEVQLEAAQHLNVPAQEVSFDFEVLAADEPSIQHVHWLACLRSEVHAWRKHTRAAGWRLPAIEHHEQAALRAALALLGGAGNLRAQPHRDWRFSWPSPTDAAADMAIGEALQALRGTPAWAWLCACGAGLRALS